MEVSGEAADGFALIENARSFPADVYLVDISMPRLDGIEASARLLEIRPESKIVILTMYSERFLVGRAFRKGIHGYILKDGDPRDIVSAIREVYRGRYYLSPVLSGYLVRRMVDKGDDI